MPNTNIKLGSQNLFGRIEEARISNIARSGSGYVQGTIVDKDIRRGFFYSGWRVVEERQQTANAGQTFGTEVVSRQFVDGLGIDDHLSMSVYNDVGDTVEQSYFFHKNARGDTVALTNSVGAIQFLFKTNTYGNVFSINEDNELEDFSDFDFIPYHFQGRRVDSETSLMYFRHRYYNPNFGRFLQRDPVGYIDSLGLYQGFNANPYEYSDPTGEFAIAGAIFGAAIDIGIQTLVQGRSFSQINWTQTALAAGALGGAVTGYTSRAITSGSISIGRGFAIDYASDIAISTVQTVAEFALDPQKRRCESLWSNILTNIVISSIFHSINLKKYLPTWADKNYTKTSKNAYIKDFKDREVLLRDIFWQHKTKGKETIDLFRKDQELIVDKIGKALKIVPNSQRIPKTQSGLIYMAKDHSMKENFKDKSFFTSFSYRAPQDFEGVTFKLTVTRQQIYDHFLHGTDHINEDELLLIGTTKLRKFANREFSIVQGSPKPQQQ